jgi:hypothetical protein
MMDHSLGYFSPPTLDHKKKVDPKVFEDMPYGTDCIAPEFALGRTSRPWDEAAGTKKGSSLQEGHSAELALDKVAEKVADKAKL